MRLSVSLGLAFFNHGKNLAAHSLPPDITMKDPARFELGSKPVSQLF
jgi:hypothetical protein